MALSQNIEAAKNAFAKRHSLDPAVSTTVEAFFTHNVLLHRNLNDFLAAQSWQREGKILVGGSKDIQLDAIVITIDGMPIRPGDSLAALEARLAEGETPLISFIFVQATSEETGGKRLVHKISAFSDGVFTFFDNDGSRANGINPVIMEWIGLKTRIFALLDEHEIADGCECAMYFVWPRNFQEDESTGHAIFTAERKITATGLVRGPVAFHAFDRKMIEEIIRGAESERANGKGTAEPLAVPAANFQKVPQSEAVATNYFGFLTARQLVGAITETLPGSDELVLRPGIFSRNIRTYLGAKQRVNHAMSETLRHPQECYEFGLRSNGIAILADAAETRADGRLSLKGAQIPNGCQTCNVLFENRNLIQGQLGDAIAIPVKIIVSADHEFGSRVAVSLNRQTPIDETRLFTGPEVVDALAWRFADPGTPQHNRAFFERRADEYADSDELDKSKVLTPYELAQFYASAFLPKPEQVASNGKQPIIDKIRKEKIFGRDQDITPYYLSGAMVLRAREALQKDPHSKDWDKYPAKNLLIYAIRLIAERKSGAGECPADLDSPEGKTYVAALGRMFDDYDASRLIAAEAVRCIILATSDAKMRLNSINAGRSALAACVRERATKGGA